MPSPCSVQQVHSSVKWAASSSQLRSNFVNKARCFSNLWSQIINLQRFFWFGASAFVKLASQSLILASRFISSCKLICKPRIPKCNSCSPVLCFRKTFCKTRVLICKVCDWVYKTCIPKFNKSNPILNSCKIVCIWALPAARAIRYNPRCTRPSQIPSGDFRSYP